MEINIILSIPKITSKAIRDNKGTIASVIADFNKLGANIIVILLVYDNLTFNCDFSQKKIPKISGFLY